MDTRRHACQRSRQPRLRIRRDRGARRHRRRLRRVAGGHGREPRLRPPPDRDRCGRSGMAVVPGAGGLVTGSVRRPHRLGRGRRGDRRLARERHLRDLPHRSLCAAVRPRASGGDRPVVERRGCTARPRETGMAGQRCGDARRDGPPPLVGRGLARPRVAGSGGLRPPRVRGSRGHAGNALRLPSSLPGGWFGAVHRRDVGRRAVSKVHPRRLRTQSGYWNPRYRLLRSIVPLHLGWRSSTCAADGSPTATWARMGPDPIA
jgi:hypothetical protein